MAVSLLENSLIVCYMILYGGVVVAAVFWMRWRRRTRWPFKESEKLLRTPGESLKRRIIELDESFILELLGGLFAMAVVVPVGLLIARKFGLASHGVGGVLIVSLLVVALPSAWRTVNLVKKRSRYLLGWFGERLAAEKLQPLSLQGYRIFHDVPAEPGKKGFNLDHVVVGLTGVAVIEVKTRRKGAARPGYKDHEVSFDGNRLDWPWSADRHGVQQAINEAAWLAKWIRDRTGWQVPVKAILTLPGWFVRETPTSAIRVVNPNFLPEVVKARGEAMLTAQQVDIIARHLEVLCRDVVD